MNSTGNHHQRDPSHGEPILEEPIEENIKDKLLRTKKKLLDLEKSIHVPQIPPQNENVVRSSA